MSNLNPCPICFNEYPIMDIFIPEGRLTIKCGNRECKLTLTQYMHGCNGLREFKCYIRELLYLRKTLIRKWNTRAELKQKIEYTEKDRKYVCEGGRAVHLDCKKCGITKVGYP